MSRKHEHKDHKDGDNDKVGEGQAMESQALADGTVQAGGDGLEKIQAERDDLLARLQRVSADYLNYQKRVQRDIYEAREYANADLVKSLLVVLDDMERALKASEANHPPDAPLLTGMKLVYDKALEVLGRFGLSIIKAKGESFDPDKHAALMQQDSDEHPANTVLTELQKGYQLKGRTIRPAAVVVSKLSERKEPEPSQ
jgi:molecular chaperone GrpE